MVITRAALVARDAERREAREIGRAMADGWGARVRELRQQGLRLPTGAGTGGRQQRRASEVNG